MVYSNDLMCRESDNGDEFLKQSNYELVTAEDG